MPMFSMYELSKVEKSLDSLRPILNEDGQEFEVFHESFKRFILDPARYGTSLVNIHNLEIFRYLKEILTILDTISLFSGM